MLYLKSASAFANYIRPLSRSITTNSIATSMGYHVISDVTPRSEKVLPPNPILILEKAGFRTEKDHYVVLGYSGQDGQMAKRIMKNGAPLQRIFVHHDRKYCKRFAENSTGRIFTFGAKLATFTEIVNHLGITNCSSNELLYNPEKLNQVLMHPEFYKYENDRLPIDITFYAPLRELMSVNLEILDAKIPNKQEDNGLDEALAAHTNASVVFAERYWGSSLDKSAYNVVDYL